MTGPQPPGRDPEGQSHHPLIPGCRSQYPESRRPILTAHLALLIPGCSGEPSSSPPGLPLCHLECKPSQVLYRLFSEGAGAVGVGTCPITASRLLPFLLRLMPSGFTSLSSFFRFSSTDSLDTHTHTLKTSVLGPQSSLFPNSWHDPRCL